MIRLLRLEAAALAALLGLALWLAAPPWPLVVAVLIAPDLAMPGYLAGPVAGVRIYNAAHLAPGYGLKRDSGLRDTHLGRIGG